MQFWTIATLMVIATTATLVVPLYWRARDDAPARWRWQVLLAAAAVPVVALGLYVWSGRPDLAAAPPARIPIDGMTTIHARAAMRAGGENGGDLDAAIEKLRTRLAANPGDADGWRLLAQSYEFQGRSQDAAEALKNTGGAVSQGDGTALAQRAEQHRRAREFPAAIAAFAELARRGNLSADQWADYADALGGARGKLDEEAAACIDAALRIDPAHTKALWLRASLQTQREDYAAALLTWQRLAEVLPADSPDSRIIAANISEARGKVPAALTASANGSVPVILRGSVRLDPRWKGRVEAGSVLFVFARAADERGPPLAVLRTTVGSWPLTFELDDRHAMMPGRKLSNYTRVILEARISRSGNALAQAGDLRAVSAVLDPRAAQPQQLMIAEEVSAATVAKGG